MGEEHKQAGIAIPMSGYPDHGSGRYANVLPYSNWFTWNTAVRVHQNAAENLVVSLVATLANYYFCTRAGWMVGTAIFVTRILYSMVYSASPANLELFSRLNTACIGGGLVLALVRSF